MDLGICYYRHIEKIFSNFIQNLKFNLIPCFENDILLSLISNRGTITLEPGCQVELSLNPAEKISDIEEEIDLYNENCNKIANNIGIKFLALGLQPISTFQNIKIIPKDR